MNFNRFIVLGLLTIATLLVVGFVVSAIQTHRRTFPLKPTISNRIFDNANLFTDSQKDSIFTLIKDLNENIGSQIAVITIESLDGQKIEEYTIEKFESLELGRFNYKDGLLFTVSVNDREMRIDVGTGLEQIIPDDLASRINQQVIAPKFRNGKFGQGIYAGVDTVKKLIEMNKERIGVFVKD
jgi:uncharacterized membrane protein YgcG